MDVQAALPAIRACIFDVDGLLINSEDIYTDSRGKIGHERLISSTSLPLTVAEFQAEVTKHHTPFTQCEPLPGVLSLLDHLSTASPSIHLATASSTTKSFFVTKTSHLPSLTSHFTPRTCLFRDDEDMQTKKGKPAGDIFLLAMERLNGLLTDDCDHASGGDVQKLRAEECLVFEDSIAGVAAGRAAGMRVCWVPHEGLREVCKGMEREVLAGNMDEVEQKLLNLEATMEDVSEGLVGTIDGPNIQGGDKADRLISEDGWAEMIGSLEHFDYSRYGIRVRG
ncbi:MAG: hypothetical protein Q9168_004283 [Polycauliona sp. 1 TL-2023]